MHETSGVLAKAVKLFLSYPRGCTLNDLTVLRAYFRLWCRSSAWDQNPGHTDETRADLARLRARCDGITNVADMQLWVEQAVEMGMDPL